MWNILFFPLAAEKLVVIPQYFCIRVEKLEKKGREQSHHNKSVHDGKMGTFSFGVSV